MRCQKRKFESIEWSPSMSRVGLRGRKIWAVWERLSVPGRRERSLCPFCFDWGSGFYECLVFSESYLPEHYEI